MTPFERPAPWLALLLAASLAIGCLSRSYPEKTQYVLRAQRVAPPSVDAAPPGAPRAPQAGILRVGRMRIAPKFERKGFVYRIGENQFERDFYSEFFEPPAVLVREATASWLDEARVFSDVVDASDPSQADWLIEGRIMALYADVLDRKSPTAHLGVSFTLFDARSPDLDVAFSGEYALDVAAERASAPAILAAWNEALTQILVQFEADLRLHLSPSTEG